MEKSVRFLFFNRILYVGIYKTRKKGEKTYETKCKTHRCSIPCISPIVYRLCIRICSGNKLATVNYTYDLLDRVESVTYDNEADVTYGYQYNAEGSLSGIKVNGVKTYDYVYDSLGRLIYSTKFQNQIPALRTSHQYDTSDRITAQNWQIGTESFSESYTYNSQDGTLSSMKIGENDTLGFQYNSLKFLQKMEWENLI